MKKLFKCLLWIFTIIIALLITLYLTAGIWLKTVVSNFVPQITKTSASLQEADVSLFSGKIALKGLKIGNPNGFQKDNAFELGEISVKFEPSSLLSSKIIINEIKINGTKVDAEFSKNGNINLLMLNNNVQEYLGNSNSTKSVTPQKVEQNATASTESGKSVIVRDLSIINSSLDFAFMTKTMNVKLPDIHEKNIGEKTKETLPELIAGIFSRLSTESIKEISKIGQESVNKLLDNLAGRSKEAAGFVKSLKTEMRNFF